MQTVHSLIIFSVCVALSLVQAQELSGSFSGEMLNFYSTAKFLFCFRSGPCGVWFMGSPVMSGHL